MNRVLKLAAVAIFSVGVVSLQLQAGVVNITQGSTSGYTMTSGNTYVIKNSVTFSNSTAGGSGMSVADNATVVLYIPAGVTLTARGANGSGRTGGGAGIRVPQTATLIITGEGTVNATGGNAGNGGNGANGNKGSTPTSLTYNNQGWYSGTGSSGAGGKGGNGGGGAGSAIGGNGGQGGNGGDGGASRSKTSNSTIGFVADGNSGCAGYFGSRGADMGSVYIIGSVVTIATSGQSGSAGFAGQFADTITEVVFGCCGGGGGGGGGAGAMSTCAIGGGGAAGGGGGGGGSGALVGADSRRQSSKPYYPDATKNVYGGGGNGGLSAIIDGETGPAAFSFTCSCGAGTVAYPYKSKTCIGGAGGTAGAVGSEGYAGTLYVSPTATVNVNRTKLSATTHSAAQYTITFDANGGELSSSDKSLTATLGCELPDCIPAPTRKGFLFDGWRTATSEEYYGASGAKSKSSYPVAGNVALYAQWQVDETYVDHTVTTPEEVPYSYFDNDYPSLLAEYGGDYEAAALATAANGHNKVWECFVAGISPTNENSHFSAKIEMVDGAPVVKWEPDLNTNGVIRAYKVYGKETLEGGGEWQYPTNSLHRFFKVTVEMP